MSELEALFDARLHLGRSWVTHEIEDDCPCGKAACGLVDSEQIDPACSQHALGAAKTMRQIHTATECPVPHEPDAMGVWSEDDELIWLPRSVYERRIDAIRWAMDQWQVSLPEVRCRSRWMRYTPFVARGYTRDDGTVDPGWSEDRWSECDRSEPGAFRVWRLEAA